MKHTLSILIFIFSLTACSNEPSNNSENTSSDNGRAEVEPRPERENLSETQEASVEDIEAIRKEYWRILNLIEKGNVREEKSKEVCKVDDGEGRLTRFFDGDEVIAMEYRTGIGHTTLTKKMYFKDNELFFVFIEDHTTLAVGPGEKGPVDLFDETRYYIESGEVIQKLTKEYRQRRWTDDPGSEGVPNQTAEIPRGFIYPDMDQVKELKEGVIRC